MDKIDWQDFAIFDFSFTNFVTTKLIKLLYGISLVFIVLGFIAMVIAAFVAMVNDSIVTGLAMLCFSPFILVIYVLLARVWSEFIIVVFRIAENIAELVEQGRDKEEEAG